MAGVTANPGPAQPSGPFEGPDPAGVRSRLTFFKVMAFAVGIGLLVLVAEMVFQYVLHWNGQPGHRANPLAWWPQPHGFVYLVYLVATALLGFKVGWTLPKMVGVMLAGCVPFLSFWVERKVAREVELSLVAGSVAS